MKRRALGTLAGFVTLGVGVFLLLVMRTFYPYRVIGLLLIMAAPLVTARLRGTPADVKLANAHLLAYVGWWKNLKRTWPAAIAFLTLFLLSFYLLYLDAVEGYDQVLPVYLFTGTGLALMGYVLYLWVPRQD